LNAFRNVIRREENPDDPPIPLEEDMQSANNIPSFVEVEFHALWNEVGTEVLAICESAIYHTGDNEHMADFNIEILPEYRRKGFGNKALSLIVKFAKKHNRRLLVTFSTNRTPAATVFLEKLGARKGMASHTNQLKVSEFDRSLVPAWLTHSQPLKSEFKLGLLDGPYPDEYLNDIAALYQEVANDQPRDDLEMEDMKYTPEFLRDIEKNIFAKGDHRWTLYLTDLANHKVVGLTEVSWSPNRAMILYQGFTGVYPEYRSKGLGRWLKAEMMQKILSERPEVEFIRTTNSNSNAPMLKINVEMGFKPYLANTIWQVETEQVEKYVLERTAQKEKP
jgi:GNAT superfamily N-acetyltransferase